ncbi:MAG: AMP-binding protein, partial [Bradyrhizobium sp.]
MPQISLGTHELDATKLGLVRKVGVTQIVAETAEPWMEGLKAILVPSDADLKAAPAVSNEWVRARPLDTLVVYQNTSGSTNIPKTFGMDLRRIRKITDIYAGDAKERRSLRAGSIEFDAHRLNRICMLIAGNTCVFLRQVNAGALVATCERAGVSIIHMGAYRLASLLQSSSGNGRLPATTAIQSGGARVPGHLRMKVKARLTDNLWVQYATSEAGLISMASPDQHDRFPEGVGFPAPEVTLEIVNAEGEILPPGEIGHIRLRKRTLPGGYVA